MPNYNESPIAGIKWTRARAATVNNELGKVPRIYFQEEEVVGFGDGQTVQRDVGSCSAAFDPDGEIPLVNPETGEPLDATCSHLQLHVILHSLYIQTAKARDQAQAEFEGENP